MSVERWYLDRRERRRLDALAPPLAPQMFDNPPSRSAVVAAARAMVGSEGRAVTLSTRPGTSHVDLSSGAVNVDGRILGRLEECDEARDVWRRVEQFLGVAAHEWGHLDYSAVDSLPRDPLFRFLHNVIEDQRVEACLIRDRPYLAPALHAARRDLLRVEREGGADDESEFEERFLYALFVLVRFETELSEPLLARHRDGIASAIEALTPFPQTPDEVRAAILRLALLVPPEEFFRVPQSEWKPDLVGSPCRKPRHRGNRGSASGARPPVSWVDAEDRPEGYAALRAELAPRARSLADRLRAMLATQRRASQRSGRLDRKRLYAYRFREQLFEANARVEEELSLSITLILDLSGSMEGPCAEIAQRVAVLLGEAVAQLPNVRLDVFGHSADLPSDGPRPPHTLITRFPIDGRGRALGLGQLPIAGNNRDAHAYRVIGNAQAAAGRPARKRIAVIVADGVPHAVDFCGDAAVAATRQSILWLEQRWGPVLFIATYDVANLRQMVPGPSLRFRAEAPVDALARNLTTTVRRCRGSVT